MSSLPFISHHLFVAAAGHDSRDEAKPSQNQPDREHAAEQILSNQTNSSEFVSAAAGEQTSTDFELSRG